MLMNNVITNKKVFLETYGCQMNEYDSELVRTILKKENYQFVPKESEADIVMLNTCAIRENAHRKVYGRVHNIRHTREGKPVMIGILGCMATNLRQELFENRNMKIDFIAGPDSYKHLPELIREAGENGAKTYDVTLSEFETYSDITPTRSEGVNAWIAVMRGCNNFCTFCVVPYTRGRERSRAPENIVEETRRLAEQGFKQVTLLGQNVNSYRYEDIDFADLLEAVSRVEGIERVRFTSPHPKDFPDKIIDLITKNSKICKHIHVPLQAGNDRVLSLMNRTYTQKEFRELIEKMRTQIPGVALSTDVIVGFPTETDAEFDETYNLMKAIEFDSAFIFKYSQRKGTIAEKKYPDGVPAPVKTERILRLNNLQRDISLKKNQAWIGKVARVLIEPVTESRTGNACVGRSDENKLVILPKGSYPAGRLMDVRITEASPHSLRGVPIHP